MSSTSEFVGHGYTVLRAAVDSKRGKLVPVGVVAWDSDREWFEIRTITDEERVTGISPQARQFGRIVVEQLSRWAEKQSVPYADGNLFPWQAEFWSAASKVLTTAIRLDEPKAIDPSYESQAALEALFEAVVQPKQPRAQAGRRVDGAVRDALAAYAGFFESRPEVSAFGGAREQVLRRAANPTGEVIIEAVNLAAANGRTEADALVSRLKRIEAAHSSRPIVFLIGYIASPGGLNGETHMRDWMRKQVTQDVYDLIADRAVFQERAANSLGRFGLVPDPSLTGFPHA